jgi:hypothetical protein
MKTPEELVMKTPEQMAEEWALSRWYTNHDPTVSGESKVSFLAGYQAAMNSLKKPDSCEHILDMKKMVDLTSTNVIGQNEKKKVMSDNNLLLNTANDYLDMITAKYRRRCGYKK